MTVSIFWDINQVSSMHIMGCMTVSMRHVSILPEAAGRGWRPRCPVCFFEESGVFFWARDLIPSQDALYMSPTQPQIAPNFRFWWISSEIWRIYIFSRLWWRPFWKVAVTASASLYFHCYHSISCSAGPKGPEKHRFIKMWGGCMRTTFGPRPNS